MPPTDATTPSAPVPEPAPKRRGNPNLGLAPRCGARTRAGCPCRAPAIRGKLRCRMHGGRSTGPRTAEGLARLRVARTIHGHYSAEARARDRHILTLARRARLAIAAVRHADRLPPEFAARLNRMAPELLPPPWPSGGLSRAEDRAVLQAEAEALAPWKLAIAAAREAGRRAIMVLPEPHVPEARPTAGAVARVPAAIPHAPDAPTPTHPAPQPGGSFLVTPPRTGSSSPAAAPGSACPAARTPRAVRSPDTADSPPAAAPPASRTPQTSAAEPSPG
jgi:hypothetical protein